MTETMIAVRCPRRMPDGQPCEADVTARLAFDAGEKRTRTEPGVPAGWDVVETSACCADGHHLSVYEWSVAHQEATQAAEDYGRDQ